MKIAIDISQIVYDTGVSVYTKNLVRNLLEIDHENEYVLYAGTLRRKADILKFTNSLKGNFKVRISLISPQIANFLWNKLHIFNIDNIIGDVDVLHTTDWSTPPTKAKKITTIHDLTAIKYPNETHPRIVKTHNAHLDKLKKDSSHIIAVSKATKSDLVEFGIKENRITVIPEAVEGFAASSASEIEKMKSKYNINNYLLSIGTTGRKNLARIAEAAGDRQLVVTGAPLEGFPYGNVKFLGHVPCDDLAPLYSGAEVLVYASLYEGFGLPILEAFAAGCPVVTSNISSMPEVAGDAAVLVDPESVKSISKGIAKAIKNKNSLIKKGKIQLKKFSWKKTAEETLRVYNLAI